MDANPNTSSTAAHKHFYSPVMPPKNPLRSSFARHWFAIEAIPIYAVVSFVVAGGTWYLARLARGPSVVWTKANPTPWNTVEQDQNVKMMSVNQKFEKSWSRDKL